MLDLRRLRLLRELDERGTIAAVADALQFTPSAVSQQLAILEREAGVPLLERAGRGVRLTDPALILVEHADALLERAALAEADLAAAAGAVIGRARIAGFQSVVLRLALPAMEALGARRAAAALRARRGRARAGAARARARRPRPRARRRVAARPAPARRRPRAPRPPRGSRPPRPAGPPLGRPAAPRRGPARRARRRDLGDRPRRHGVGRDDGAHVPRARRLRPRHPPPDERRERQPGARRARARGRAAAGVRRCRRGSAASRCGRSRARRRRARSSPSRARPTPPGPRRAPCWPRSAPRPRRCPPREGSVVPPPAFGDRPRGCLPAACAPGAPGERVAP